MQVRQEPPQGRAADSRNRRALSKPLPRQRPCLTGRKNQILFFALFPSCFANPLMFLLSKPLPRQRTCLTGTVFFFAAAVLRMPVVVALADALQKAKFAKAF